ncbi:MAG: sigma-54-dependent Fis family transcriptional regulator [Deltaproteobacteria bacterium]|nr:sigma-54-dependent Fis family transcriptional regulator [Deltaproteobacteria bacterium]
MIEQTDRPKIVIADDEQIVLDGLLLMLESSGFSDIITVSDSRKIMNVLSENRVKVLLLDLSMPHIGGQKILNEVATLYPDLPVIVVTGFNDVNTAISCMKSGAFDYLVKPVDDARLSSSVKRAVEFGELKDEYKSFKARIFNNEKISSDAFGGIVTSSQSMHNIFKYIETIAPTERPVLITGETGTGKELVAKAVHLASGVKGPFVSVNVAGLDEQMFQDTLFGHNKGAFTGAVDKRAGLVAKAAGGTLFLDEIGDLSMELQVKLLRLLQENEYFPAGSDVPVSSTCRILVATNVDLPGAINDKRFRSDLFFRLRTHNVELPPLRERKEDIPLLVWHFIKKSCDELGKPFLEPPGGLSELLFTYNFPGNIRELESMVFESVSSCTDSLLKLDYFKEYILGNRGITNKDSDKNDTPINFFSMFSRIPSLEEGRRMLIDEALKRAEGNQTVASQMLGITRTGLNKALSRMSKNES